MKFILVALCALLSAGQSFAYNNYYDVQRDENLTVACSSPNATLEAVRINNRVRIHCVEPVRREVVCEVRQRGAYYELSAGTEVLARTEVRSSARGGGLLGSVTGSISATLRAQLRVSLRVDAYIQSGHCSEVVYY